MADVRTGPARPPHQKCRGTVPISGTTQLGTAIAKISSTRPKLRTSLARTKRLDLALFMQSITALTCRFDLHHLEIHPSIQPFNRGIPPMPNGAEAERPTPIGREQ
jgi:hypothetical protein